MKIRLRCLIGLIFVFLSAAFTVGNGHLHGQTVVAEVPVGSFPSGVGVNPNTNRVYVGNDGSGTVSAIDGATNKVIATMEVGTRPSGVGVNPNTNRVYVANEDNVSVVDGATNKVIATVPLETSPNINHNVAVNSNTNRVYVTNRESNTVSVIDDEITNKGNKLCDEFIKKNGVYVEDSANIISDIDEKCLTGYLQELEQKTGAQMIVLTVDTTGDISIEKYAIEFATKWKLGQKGKDNGVLVVVAKGDRAYRIEVGCGLEGVLPDSFCETVGRTYFVSNFRKGQYSEGIFQAVVEMAHKIAENNGVKITGMLDQSSKEEAIRSQQKKEKEDVRKRLDEFLKKNGVEAWPSMNELSANPFVYEGKTIALMASFSKMETATQGIFNNSRWPFTVTAVSFVVTDIPKGMFKKSGTIVVLAGKVLGKTELQIPLLGLMQVPHLKFVGVHFCKDGNCSDIISE